jgi:hypothetical protein
VRGPALRIVGASLAVAGISIAFSGCSAETAVPPRMRITFSRALSYARAVELRQSDLPGWRQVDSGAVERISQSEVAFAHCDGGVDPTQRVVTVRSPIYKGSEVEMWSEIVVMPARALASKDVAPSVMRRASGCFGAPEHHDTLELGGVGKGAAEVRETLSRRQPPLAGMPDGFGLQVTHTYGPPFDARSPKGLTDISGFVIGAAEVFIVARAAEPFPKTEKEGLVEVLQRAERDASSL